MVIDRRVGRSLLAVALALGLAACETAPPAPDSIAAPVVSPVVSGARFTFLPIANAPAEQVATLRDALAEEAERRGIVIVPEEDPSVTYTVQGYLSTVSGASGTILVYVFDVFDRDGVRVHRVSGQETSTRSAPDPWTGIGDETMGLAAQRVVDSLYAWLRRN